jgi:hypothetical protein
MSNFVRIQNGSYRGASVHNRVFRLVKDYTVGAKGGYITVLGDEGKPIRVKISSIRNIEPVAASEATTAPAGVMAYTLKAKSKAKAEEDNGLEYEAPIDSDETDDAIMARVAARFEILNEMTLSAKNGDIRAMVVSGAPGVGKSYGVETTLEQHSMFDKLVKKVKHEVVKGAMTPIGLYKKLFDFSDANCVLVFDDCDAVFHDDLSLNILKAALDTGRRRRIHWNADSSLLRREGIPNAFDFHGSVIFITNIKLDNVKSRKLRGHIDALMDRSHYLDLTIHTTREKLLRIKQIAQAGGLFSDEKYGFTEATKQEIVDFIHTNADKMRTISLRMALKIADLVKSSPTRWKDMAAITCMKG